MNGEEVIRSMDAVLDGLRNAVQGGEPAEIKQAFKILQDTDLAARGSYGNYGGLVHMDRISVAIADAFQKVVWAITQEEEEFPGGSDFSPDSPDPHSELVNTVALTLGVEGRREEYQGETAAHEGREADFLKTLIVDLVANTQVSARLLTRALAFFKPRQGVCAIETVQQYLQLGPDAVEVFYREHGFSLKTAEELDNLVMDFARESRRGDSFSVLTKKGQNGDRLVLPERGEIADPFEQFREQDRLERFLRELDE